MRLHGASLPHGLLDLLVFDLVRGILVHGDRALQDCVEGSALIPLLEELVTLSKELLVPVLDEVQTLGNRKLLEETHVLQPIQEHALVLGER